MKRKFILFCLFLSAICSQAQIGIGTTTPNSTLDVRGSIAQKYTSFSSNTTAGSSDNTLVFTGTTGFTLTLPDATACQGRIYWIKNSSSNSSILMISTTSSQKIDGLSSWVLAQTNKAIRVVSDGANWLVTSESVPGNSGTSWIHGGNSVASTQNIGTTSNFDLPFITNNTEKMRLSASGNLAIGTSSFNGTYPEKLLVDAGVTTSVNAIVGKGNINNYLQLNIQNANAGTNASSDVVATADNGNETSNYIDMGINSSLNTSGAMGGANDAYLYNLGQNLLIGTGSASKSLVLMTGGTTQSSNERMRITGTGNIGIANTAPTEKLDVTGNVRFSGALMPNNSAGTAGYILVSSGAGAAPTWQNTTGYIGAQAWLQDGNTFTAEQNFGTISSHDIPFITNNTEKMRLTTGGFLGMGTNAPAGKLHIVTDNSEFGDDYITEDYGSSTTQGFFIRKARGTVASPANLQSGDLISYFRFLPRYNGSMGYVDGSGMDAYYKGSGTNNLTDLRFFTSNAERMRMNENGGIGIGTSTFSGTNPEKLIVDAGTPSTSTDFQNVIVGKGNTNSYAQLNIQNTNTGNAASSDVVATANNGSESVNFIDMGVNGGGNGSTGILGGANTAYLYSTADNLMIGNATNSKNVSLYTTVSGTSSERVTILGAGSVGVNNTAPVSTLDVAGSTGSAITTTSSNITLDATHGTVIITANTPTITLPAASGCTRRIYIIVNQTSGGRTISSYKNMAGGNSTTTASQGSITLQSDGTNWYQIR
jgi:hypothetical protein